jgi:hypothetical protein
LAYLSCNAKRFTLLPLEDLRMRSDNESAFFADASALGVSLRHHGSTQARSWAWEAAARCQERYTGTRQLGPHCLGVWPAGLGAWALWAISSILAPGLTYSELFEIW